MNNILVIATLSLAVNLQAQQKTISQSSNERTTATGKKVLIIPFEPRLYMSEVDHSFNAETKLTFKEIRHRFRVGTDIQLSRAFRSAGYSTVDLLEDTVKYRKDLETVYRELGYEYMKVPDQQNYKPPVKEQEEKKITKGQLVVETNGDKRFMNARLHTPSTLPALSSRHKADVFVFVNELDIRSAGTPDQMTIQSPRRRLTVHYTVFNSAGREINSGIAEDEFDPSLNNPRKIIDKHLAGITQEIAKRVDKALTAK